MDAQITTPSRLSSFGLTVIHALALFALYFVPVFICPTVVGFYERFGVAETPLFLQAHLISDFVAGFPWLFYLVSLYYLVLIYRLRRSSWRWLPAMSSISLLAIVVFGMIYTAWMIDPMVFADIDPVVVTNPLAPSDSMPPLASKCG